MITMGEVFIKGYKCERCGHQWVPRLAHQRPALCPKCKNARWDVPKEPSP